MKPAGLLLLLGCGLAGAATPKVLVVAGRDDSFTVRALQALGVTAERLAPAALERRSPFDWDLVIWGLDEGRDVLVARADAWQAWLRSGGVFVGLRSSGPDGWLPSPVRRDKAFQLGEVLAAQHPLFTGPHRLDRAALGDVHGGSIYSAFRELGPGWVPLVSAGAEQTWDKTPSLSAATRYGLIELPVERGRVVLCQLIPEYHWFYDTKGDARSAGARLFENLVRYALSRSGTAAATRPPRVVPETFRADLSDLLATPRRRDGLDLAAPEWRFSSQGPYTHQVDRRGVLTFTHADQPSTAGSYAQLSRPVMVPADAARVVLRWYETDTYCGGREIVLGGAKHGQTAFENYQRGQRFAQVLVNQQVVWSEDVCGRNPQPARRAFRSADVTAAVKAAGGRCEVALRVTDVKGSGEHPFAIDVFFGTVDLLTDFVDVPAGEVLNGAEWQRTEAGGLSLPRGRGAATGTLTVPAGRYAVALKLRDEPTGRGTVRLAVAGRQVAEWTLSADDLQDYWAVAPVVALPAGATLRVEAACDGGEPIRLSRVAVVPERLLASPARPVAPPSSRDGGLRRVEFPVTVRCAGGLARTQEVAAQGLPFPPGCLRDPQQVRVTDPAGAAVPVQTRRIALWPDGSIKSAVVAFPVTLAAGASAVYRVTAGEGVTPVPASGVTVREQADRVEVDTGRVAFALSRRGGTLFEQVRRGDQALKTAGDTWELCLVDEAQRSYRSGGDTVAATRLVEAGPLRALIVRTGTLHDGQGRRVDYRLTTEATAGSDRVRVEATIINREDQPEVYVKRWSLALRRPGAAGGRVWLDEQRSVPAEAGAVLYQHREDQYTWTGAEGRSSRQAGRAPGWVRLPGLLAGPRWFWQRYPQAVRFAADEVRFDLLPEPFDNGDLPTRWAERMRTMTDRYSVGGVGYPQSPGKMGLFRLGQGEALSQEFEFVFDGQGVAAQDAAALVAAGTPLRAAPDATYVASTRAFGQLSPVDSKRFGAYEESTERAYQAYLAQRAKRREYGFENFGDLTFEWGYGPSYTFWSNSEYDHHHGFALQYLRSGDPRWWVLHEETARFYRDVVVVHHGPAGSPHVGGPRHHNATTVWMPQDPTQFWVADHNLAGTSAGHSWVEGLIDYWLLTGDPWADEVIQHMATWYCERAERNEFGAGGQERGPGWALIAISALAGATGGERIHKAGWLVADWLMQWQDPVRGVISVPISEQPSYEGGSTFMHGIVGRGLGRWYDVTGDPRVKDACLGIAEWITSEPMGPKAKFWYKQSPQNSKRPGADGQCLSALSYAWVLSGDDWFGDVTAELLRLTRADVRSMSWYPQSLAQIAPYLERHPGPVK